MRGTAVRPTEGHCDVALAFHIEEGDFNGVPLGDLNFVAANYTPGPMGDGNWTSALYLDERANPQQRAALEHILSGQMGYTDHGMHWDNTGKNGHYASFDWSWP